MRVYTYIYIYKYIYIYVYIYIYNTCTHILYVPRGLQGYLLQKLLLRDPNSKKLKHIYSQAIHFSKRLEMIRGKVRTASLKSLSIYIYIYIYIYIHIIIYGHYVGNIMLIHIYIYIHI